ncbi:DUF348 domain-containing protein [Patescibacteria group bacterium]|nr:MAG: DUF348 domain-containing protein [Patescibacteria group bacterium]
MLQAPAGHLFRTIIFGIAMTTLAVVVIGLVIGVIPPPKSALADSSRIVSVYADGHKKVITTESTTVRASLGAAGIEVHEGDLVEPNLDTDIPAGFFNVNVYRSRPVVVVDGAKKMLVQTALQSPKLIAEAAGLKTYPEDTFTLNTIADPTNVGTVGQQVVIDRATPVLIEADGKQTVVRTQQATVGALLAERDVALGPQDTVDTPREAVITPNLVIKVNRVKIVIAREETKIERATETVKDPQLEAGKTEVREEGKDGVKVAMYRVNYNNGVEAGRQLLSQQVTEQPVTKVIVVGTKQDDAWYKLRLCESGNNYGNKRNPFYRGAYQFSYGTWSAMGGSGDPADASPSEQDMRAKKLFERSGASQWPICGRFLSNS